MKKIFKITLFAFIALLLLLLSLFGYLFFGKKSQAENIAWGVCFSQKHAQDFKLDWKKTYLALMDDLGIKRIKTAVHWDLIEPKKGEYYFEDMDWQIKEAENREVKILLIIGMKTGRWPECHLPQWATNLNKQEQQKEILAMLEQIVLRYKDSPAIKYWQIENEPLYPFGVCPWSDKEFLKKEVELVKKFDDQKHPIVITSSGEWSLWLKEAKIGDIVGTSLYKIIWFGKLERHITYHFPPIYFWRRLQIIKHFFNKDVICTELQAEPWGSRLLYDSPLEEQKKSMNLKQFRENMEFAKATGFDKFYLWGGEWWYWMKTIHKDDEMWNEAKKIFLVNP